MSEDETQAVNIGTPSEASSSYYYGDPSFSKAIEDSHFDFDSFTTVVGSHSPQLVLGDSDSEKELGFHVPQQDPHVGLGDQNGESLESPSPTLPLPHNKRTAEAPLSGSPSKRTRTASGSGSAPGASHSDPDAPCVLADPGLLSARLRTLAWGVQWEVARLMPTGRDIYSLDPTIPQLRGTHQMVAPKVLSILSKVFRGEDSLIPEVVHIGEKEQAVKNPWTELDMEEMVLSKDPLGCLGADHSNPEVTGQTNWYGGKVHFTGKLISLEKGEPSITLNKPYLGFSNRFTRRFGSGQFMRIKINPDLVFRNGETLVNFFKRPIVIFNRVFRAFYSKDYNVFLFATNETYNGFKISPSNSLVSSPGPKHGMSLFAFLSWHNDLSNNTCQTMTKWASRFALGLSNSVPGIRIEPENLHFIPDIVSPTFKLGSNESSSLVMTDGCGFGSARLFHDLTTKFGWKRSTCAIQCRINGAKGLLVLHPESYFSEGPSEVWIRDSQRKINYSSAKEDHAHFIIDVLRFSRLTTPAKLSAETIINLAENGVAPEVFVGLLKEAVTDRVSPLLTWEGQNGPRRLWDNVAKEGHVFSARSSRDSPGLARVLGQIRDDKEEEWDDGDGMDQLDVEEKSTAWWEDPISGCPSSLEETVMRFIDSGFLPDKLKILGDKLEQVAKKALISCITKFHIEIKESCTAFVIPDPCNVLEPGEVQIISSNEDLVSSDGYCTDIILGDVLLTRHPCKIATDVQKAKAVLRNELYQYKDVIVVSTKGHIVDGQSLDRHLASMTGGGDFDGDTMHVFWNKDLLQGFKEADPSLAETPQSVMDSLQQAKFKVTEFLEEHPDPEKDIHLLQGFLLGALRYPGLVGKYSNWWEKSVYHKGYFHTDTIRLAYLFCEVLDSIKTGKTVKPEVLASDRNNWDKWMLPKYKATIEPIKSDMSNALPVQRDMTLHPPFIMDILANTIIKIRGEQTDIIHKKLQSGTPRSPDLALIGPWKRAIGRAEDLLEGSGPSGQYYLMADELEKIREHVETVYEQWVADREDAVRKHKARTPSARQPQKFNFTDLPIQVRQDTLRKLSYKFATEPSPESYKFLANSPEGVKKLKASYAYYYVSHGTSRGPGSRWFPWDVAMGELCDIKTASLPEGRRKVVTGDFYDAFTLHKKSLEIV